MVQSKVLSYNLDVTKLVARLKNLEKSEENQVDKAIHDSGLILEGEIKASIAGRRGEPTSVDTGKFMQTMMTDNSTRLISRIISPVNYGIYLEEGTSRIRPRKHFRNSFSRTKPTIVHKIADSMKIKK